jgi:plasmid stabilization system protein ParE
MDYRVIFKDSFIDDLERIVRTIGADDPFAARKFGEQTIRMSESLTFFPERHPRVRQRPHMRRFIVKKYFKVFYRIQQQSRIVEILRCWDGRRENEPGFFDGMSG